MHRPLPESALIRRVSVQRVRIGKDYRYRLLITLQHDTPASRHDAPLVAAIGIHIGFQDKPAGIRFGYWADTADRHAELVLPRDIVSQFERVDELRGIIDRNWNDIRAAHRVARSRPMCRSGSKTRSRISLPGWITAARYVL